MGLAQKYGIICFAELKLKKMREITLSKLQNGESINPKQMKLEIPLDLKIDEVKVKANEKV